MAYTFTFFRMSSKEAKSLISMYSNLSISPFMFSTIGSRLRNTPLIQDYKYMHICLFLILKLLFYTWALNLFGVYFPVSCETIIHYNIFFYLDNNFFQCHLLISLFSPVIPSTISVTAQGPVHVLICSGISAIALVSLSISLPKTHILIIIFF